MAFVAYVHYMKMCVFIVGKFGIVNKGWYTKENSNTIMVAIKTLQGYDYIHNYIWYLSMLVCITPIGL